MGDEAAPKPPPDPAVLRKRVWIAVGGVVGLWFVIYVSVVATYVLGGPSDPNAVGTGPGVKRPTPVKPADPHAGHSHGPGGHSHGPGGGH